MISIWIVFISSCFEVRDKLIWPFLDYWSSVAFIRIKSSLRWHKIMNYGCLRENCRFWVWLRTRINKLCKYSNMGSYWLQAGPFRWEQQLSNREAFLLLVGHCSQASNSFSWSCLYFLLWIRFNFLSDISSMRRTMSILLNPFSRIHLKH